MAEEYLYKVLIIKLLPPGGYTKNELFEVICNKINIPYCVISTNFEVALNLLVADKLLQVSSNRYYKTQFCERVDYSSYSLSFVIQDIRKMYAQKLPNFSVDIGQQNNLEKYGMCPPVVMFPDELEDAAHGPVDDISCEPPRKKLHLDQSISPQNIANFDQPSSSNNCGFRQDMDTSEADSTYYPNMSVCECQDSDSEDYEPPAKRSMLNKPPFK